MKVYIVIIISFLIILNNEVRAKDIKETVNYIFKKNTRVQLVKRSLETTILEKHKLITEFMPDLNVEVSKTLQNAHNVYVRKTKLEKINKSFVEQYNIAINIEQEVFSGGIIIIKFAILNSEINIMYQEYNKTLNDIVSRCLQYYQNLISIRKLLKIHKENIIIIRKVFQQNININKKTRDDKSLFLKVILNNAQINFKELLKQHIEITNMIQHYTKKEINRIIEEIPENFTYEFKNRRRYKILYYYNNPDLEIIKLNIKNNKRFYKISYSYVLPKINIFCNRHLNVRKHNNFFNEKHRILFDNCGIKIFIPILQKGGIQYMYINEARKKNIQSKYLMIDMLENIAYNIKNLWHKYTKKKSAYIISRKMENKCYEEYINNKLDFLNGNKSLINMLNKKKNYNISTIIRIKKENSYIISKIQINHLVENILMKI